MLSRFSAVIASILIVSSANTATIPRFADPVPVPELNSTARDQTPWVRADGLEVYFASDRGSAPTVYHIYHSTRPSLDAAFGPPARVWEINQPLRQANPFVSANGLTMYFIAHSPDRTSDGTIWQITRPSLQAPWDSSTQQWVPGVNTGTPYEHNAGPHVTADGLVIYFHRVCTYPQVNLYRAVRGSVGEAFGPAQPLADFNTSGTEYFPFITRDGLMFFFCSNREGGHGSFDLYVAVRDSTDEPFGSPVNLANVNGGYDDMQPFYHEATRTLYFRTTRPDARKYDVYCAQRIDSPPPAYSCLLEWSTFLGGSAMDRCFGIATDAAGNVVAVIETQSSDFLTTGGFDTTFNGGGSDNVVAKFRADGKILWSTFLGGSGEEAGRELAVDGEGNVYVTGLTSSVDFPVPGGYDTTLADSDAFVTKIDRDGQLLWSTFLGGSGRDWGFDVVTDDMGNVYVAGNTQSDDFPTPGGGDTNLGGPMDTFLAKFSSAGALLWARYYGGSGEDYNHGYGDGGFAWDGAGGLYVTGRTESTDLPTPGGFDPSYNGGADSFVAKFSTADGALLWATYLGGTNTDSGHGVAVDPSGSVYASGWTLSPDYPTSGAYDPTYNGDTSGYWIGGDSFLTKLSGDGALVWSTYLGGSSADTAFSLETDASGDIWVSGSTSSDDFPTPGGYDTTHNGGYGTYPNDAFLAKFSAGGSLVWATFLGAGSPDGSRAVAVDDAGGVYIAGETASPDFPTKDGYDPTFAGGFDAFLTKFDLTSSRILRFSEPVPVSELNSSGKDHTPWVSADGLEIYFASDRGRADTRYRIYHSARSRVDDPFGPAALVDEINQPSRQANPFVSDDGLIMYFASDRLDGRSDAALFQITRSSKGIAWDSSTQQPIPGINIPGVVELNGGPHVRSGGLVIYFHRTPGWPGATDLCRATRSSLGAAFGPAEPLVEFNSDAVEYFPFITSDGLMFFFCSNRAGGRGGFDLYVAVRHSVNEPFGAPQNLVDVNSAYDDMQPFFHEATRTLYFRTTRDGGGNYNIYACQLIPCGSAPEIAVSPDSFSLTVQQFDTTPTRALEIANSGGGTLQYDIAASPSSLLRVTPASGQSSGEAITHTVHFKTPALTPGSYSGEIVVTSPHATNSPVSIPLQVTIRAGFCPADRVDLLWSTFLGGGAMDRCMGIATDAEGNAYVTGDTQSLDFPTLNAFSPVYNGGAQDGYVAKFSRNGQLLWSTYLGGSGTDLGMDIAVDDAGNVYVAGGTVSPDFPTSGGGGSFFGSTDAFVTKFSANGALQWSACLGGSGKDHGVGIALDGLRNVYVTGCTESADFPTPGGYDTTYNGGQDIFVTKYTSDGVLVWSTYMGGSARDWGPHYGDSAIAWNGEDAVYVTGVTESADFPAISGHDSSHNGGSDAFVGKFSIDGALLWSTYVGGTSGDYGHGVAVDGERNLCLTGWTHSADFPTLQGWDTSYNGDVTGEWIGGDAFVSKFSSGGTLLWSTYLGGKAADPAVSINADAMGNVYVSGWTDSRDFPIRLGYDVDHNGGSASNPYDAFVATFNAEGTLVWSTFLGASCGDGSSCNALTDAGDVFVAGNTESTDFPTTAGYDMSYNGAWDTFVTKFRPPKPGIPRFTAPVPVSELNSSGYDTGLWLTPDGLEAYFSSDREDSLVMYHIYHASRLTLAEPFGSIVRVTEINHPPRQQLPSLTDDGLSLYFESERADHLAEAGVWEITRPTAAGPWDSATQRMVPGVNTPMIRERNATPYVTPDGLAMYFARRPPTQTHHDLYRSVRNNRVEDFHTPEAMTQFNSDAGDAFPFMTRDGLMFFFGSNRPGGRGDWDLYVAVRDSTSEPFGQPVNLWDVNSDKMDGQPFFHEPTQTLYFHSGRGGDYDIYACRLITCQPEPAIAVSPNSFSLTVQQFDTTPTRTLEISNSGGGTLQYDIVASPSSLLRATPASGQSSGGANRHYVDFSTPQLLPGVYTGDIIVSGNAGNSPVTVPVTVTVVPPGEAEIGVLHPSLSLTLKEGLTTSARPLQIRNTGGGVLVYSVTGTPPSLLDVTPSYGQVAGANVIPHEVYYKTPDLAPGSYNGAVVISGNATNSPYVILLTVTVVPHGHGPTNLAATQVDTGPAAPFQLQPNDPIVISAFIENAELGQTPPFWVEVWGSRTGGLTLDRFLTTSLYLPAGLPGGGTFSWASSASLYGVPDGPYTVVYVVDRPGDVVEMDERNNRTVVPGKRLLVIRPQTQVDLAVEDFGMAPNPAQGGQQVAFSGRVTNRGAEPSGPFWVEFWGSWDWPYPSLNFFLCDSIAVANLDPGAVLDLANHPRALYTGLPAGLFLVGCVADRDDAINERDETNNYDFIEGQVLNMATLQRRKGEGGELTGADLTLVRADFSPAAPVQSTPGDTITVTAQLANRGNVDSGSFWLEFWGSRDGGLTLNAFLMDSIGITNLAPGQTVSLSWSKGLYSIPDGPYSVVVVADRPGGVAETDEANNRLAIAGKRLLIVRPQTDANLVVEDFQFAPVAGQWPEIRLGGAVRNLGAVDSGPFWVEFWACAGDSDYPTPDRFACDSIAVANLAPGELLDLAACSRTLYDVPEGLWTIICVVDRLDQVAESNETDNTAFVRGFAVVEP